MNTTSSLEVKLIKEKKIVLNDFEAQAACLHIWYFLLNVVNNEEPNYFFLLKHFILITFFKETCTVECILVVCMSSFGIFPLKDFWTPHPTPLKSVQNYWCKTKCVKLHQYEISPRYLTQLHCCTHVTHTLRVASCARSFSIVLWTLFWPWTL